MAIETLPDFGEWTWDQIVEARDSAAGIAFREMVSRVCSEFSSASTSGADYESIKEAIGLRFDRELVAEINKRRVTPGSAAMGLLLNAIPGSFWLSGAKELLALGHEQQSWYGVVDYGKRQL
jgi:hypothetical protein